MRNELLVKDIDFFGDTLIAAQDEEGIIWAGVRWLCEGIGLSKGQMQNERNKIQEDIVLKQGERNLILPTNGGKQEVLCLQLDFVPIWLAKITVTPSMQENNPILVDKLVEYQLKAKDVLAAAFLPKQKQARGNQVPFKEVVEVIPLIAEDLGVNNISKLIMYKGACKDYNVPTNFLPNYIDNGDREKKSATELLKQFQCGISAKKFNELMVTAGYLEERERKSTSSKTGIKKYKVLTEKGKKYGENQTAEQNAKEPHPLYYVDTFPELYNLVVQEVA